MTGEEIKDLSLEDTFTQIDDIMARLQDDTTSLEASFDLYKEGMEMLGHCKSIIDTVEKKVIALSGDIEEE